MKKMILVLVLGLIGFSSTAQTFVSQNGYMKVNLDIDNERIDLIRNGVSDTYEIAWIRNFPITHSDFACLGGDVFAIRLKINPFNGKAYKCVIIHTDYSKEKYRVEKNSWDLVVDGVIY